MFTMIKPLAVVLFLITLVWSVLLYLQPVHTLNFNYLYNLGYGLFFLVASLISFRLISHYPHNRNSLLSFGIGFFLYFAAQCIWMYFNLILKSEIPYPSIADFFWLLFYVTIGFGIMKLLDEINSPIRMINIIEIVVLSGIFYLMISSFLSGNTSESTLSWGAQLLNYLYPVIDAVLVGLAIVVLRSQLGKLHTNILYFVFSFFMLALGDTLFSYQSALNSYWNGNITDVIYSFSGFLLLLGMVGVPQMLKDAETVEKSTIHSNL